MSLLIKISKNATKSDRVDLCKTCRYVTILEGAAIGQEYRECSMIEGNLPPWRVTDCSGYMAKNETSLNDMKEQAWILRTDSTRKKIGFLSPLEVKKLSGRDRNDLNLPDPYDL